MMTKRLKSLKLWPLFVAVSAVVILAGIILYALLGFNTSPEKPEYKTFEVQYDVVAVINEKEEEVQKVCEDSFKANGLTFESKEVYEEVAGSLQTTSAKSLVYQFKVSASDEALGLAKAAVQNLVLKDAEGAPLSVEMTVTVNTVKSETFHEAGWRAAVAIAVGAVVVLIYIGIRFGVASALSGLVGVVNASFFTFGFFAITRIPVFAVAPLLYAAIAAISFTLLWLLHCMKMRENFKDPDFGKFEADEAVAESLKTSDKFVYFTAGALGIAVLLIGAIATAGVRLLALPALVAVAVSLYSASLLSPSVHIYCKRAFDKIKKNKTPKYSGKKKMKLEGEEQAKD
ncbi:MAG: hypothetical protein K2L02_04875 [Clostridia bacterium]|nr:hypothetical protein [Clostridia bacterium]